VSYSLCLQAFNWESHHQRWWNVLADKVDRLADWGFTSLWLPPAWDSLSPQGLAIFFKNKLTLKIKILVNNSLHTWYT